MEDAATVDLRGHTVLPLRAAGDPQQAVASIGDAGLRGAVQTLARWARSGAHRIDRNRDGSYEHSEAIRLLDAWWEPLMRAEFQPTLGKPLFEQIRQISLLDDPPSLHLGSAYNGGWYVYANKDLRTVLGQPVRGRYSRVYCGGRQPRRAAARRLLAQPRLGRSAPTPTRPAAPTATSATSRCASTRSASGPRAASPSPTSPGRTGRPSSRRCRCRGVEEGGARHATRAVLHLSRSTRPIEDGASGRGGDPAPHRTACTARAPP